MSNANPITLKSKFKPWFSSPISSRRNSSLLIWPKRVSHARWQNLLKSCSWFLGKSKKYDRSSKRSIKWKTSHEGSFPPKEASEIKPEIERKPLLGLINELTQEENEKVPLELITILKLFLQRKNISQDIEETIPDRRNQELITYSKQSIMMSALSIFLLRMASGNKYDDKFHDKDKYSRANIAKFIDAPEDRAPVIKTIETFLKNLEENSINNGHVQTNNLTKSRLNKMNFDE